MSFVDGLTGNKSEGRLVAVASTASANTFLAKRLILVAFDLPNSIAD
jgi:hypothetical protein